MMKKSKPKNLNRITRKRLNMKYFSALILMLTILFSCNSQKKYSDFDISYSKSGGYAPVYENLLIKGNNAHYAYESRDKKVKKSFTVSDEDLRKIEQTLSQNSFRKIEEDHKKLYDNITIAINIKKGPHEGSKNDGSMIRSPYQAQWKNITEVFQEIINTNIKN